MGLLRRSYSRDVARKDRKYLGRSGAPSDSEDIEIVGASGCRLRDVEGRTYLDFQSGWCVGNLGWNPPEILARVRDFDGPMYVAPDLLYEPWTELAELLVESAPGRLARAFRCVGGTEAVELALQLAIAHTGRPTIVSIAGADHGNSIATRSLRDAATLAPPLDKAALDRLETLLSRRDVAACIMEPIVLEKNVLVPDAAFMHGLVELCHDHGTLVIMDEIGTGFGRCGRMFASELFGVEPDLMTLGKAITSGVAPLATTLATEDVAETALAFDSTYGWQPLAVEAAIATQLYWRDHRDALLGNVAARSAQARQQLSLMEFRAEPELRIQGLAIGVGLGDASYATRLAQRCREVGLLLHAKGESLVMFPALTIDQDAMQEGLAILAEAVRR